MEHGKTYSTIYALVTKHATKGLNKNWLNSKILKNISGFPCALKKSCVKGQNGKIHFKQKTTIHGTGENCRCPKTGVEQA